MTRDELLAAVEAQAAQFDQGRLTVAELRSWLHGLHTDSPESLQRLAEVLDSDDGKDRLGPNGWLAVRGILDDLHAESRGTVDGDAWPANATTTPAVEAPPSPPPPLRNQRANPDWEMAAAQPVRSVAYARRPIVPRHRHTRLAVAGVVLLSVFAVLGLSAVAALALSPGLWQRVPIEAPSWVPREWMIRWAEEDRPVTGPPDSAVVESLTTRVQGLVPVPDAQPQPQPQPQPEPQPEPEPEPKPEPEPWREPAPEELETVQEVEQRTPPDDPSQRPASVPTRFSLASSQLRVPRAEPAILLPVFREGPLDEEAWLRFQLLPGSARPDEDYVSSPDSIVRFAVGEERALIIVPLYRGGGSRSERNLRVRLLVDDPATAGDVMDVRITLAGSD